MLKGTVVKVEGLDHLEVSFPNGIRSRMRGKTNDNKAFAIGDTVYVENYRGSRFVCIDLADVEEAKEIIDKDIERAIASGKCLSCGQLTRTVTGFCTSCDFRLEADRLF
jgi:hypothetical protein